MHLVWIKQILYLSAATGHIHYAKSPPPLFREYVEAFPQLLLVVYAFHYVWLSHCSKSWCGLWSDLRALLDKIDNLMTKIK